MSGCVLRCVDNVWVVTWQNKLWNMNNEQKYDKNWSHSYFFVGDFISSIRKLILVLARRSNFWLCSMNQIEPNMQFTRVDWQMMTNIVKLCGPTNPTDKINGFGLIGSDLRADQIKLISKFDYLILITSPNFIKLFSRFESLKWKRNVCKHFRFTIVQTPNDTH